MNTKISRVILVAVAMLMVLFAMGSCKDIVTSQDNGWNTGGTPGSVTLKERINNAKAGEEIDLGKETLTIPVGESYTVDKAITIKNGDAKNATFTITGSGATLKNMRNIESVIAGEELGDGDLAIRNCYEIDELHVNGGGENSIHISATIILNMEVNKENVRIVLEDETGASSKASIKNAEINVTCTLDSDDAQTAFENVNVSAEVEKVTLSGKANVESVLVQSKEDGTIGSTIHVTSNDVVIKEASDENGFGLGGDSITAAEGVIAPTPASVCCLLHDESCTCGGKVTYKSHSEGGFVIENTGAHEPFGTENAWQAGNAYWKTCFQYVVETPVEGPYVISFEAKSDSICESCIGLYNLDKNIHLASEVPLEYTKDYKKYNYLVYVTEGVESNNYFEFTVPDGKIYIRNLTFQRIWDENTQFGNSDLAAWSIWQDPSCTDLKEGEEASGHITVMDMTPTSVKAVRNTCFMKEPEFWKLQLTYNMPNASAGKYRMSFTDNSYASWDSSDGNVLSVVEILFWDETLQKSISIKNVEGFTGKKGDKYYFYFDIPSEYIGKNIEMDFLSYNVGEWRQDFFVLDDVKLEKVTEETELSGYIKLY